MDRVSGPIKFLAALAALLTLSVGPLHAQTAPALATVVPACGTPPSTYASGQNRPVTQDTTGTLCSASGGGGGGNVTIVAPLGSKVSAQSVSTVLASDQSAIPVTSGVAQASTTSGQTISPIGCRTLNAPATDTTAQTNMPRCALDGGFVVWPYSNPENLVSGGTAAMTGTTSTSMVAAPASGLRNYLTNITCTNSHATVGTFVVVQDGSGGTTIYEAYAAAVGGGFSIVLPAPLRQPTTATAIFVADVTTGANVICFGSGFKAP